MNDRSHPQFSGTLPGPPTPPAPPGGPGLVDQLSFVVMRRFGLREVVTNDRHFRDGGFEPLF